MSYLAGNGIRHIGQRSSLNPSDFVPLTDVSPPLFISVFNPDFIPNSKIALDWILEVSSVPAPASTGLSGSECSAPDPDFPSAYCSHTLTSDLSLPWWRELGALWVAMRLDRSCGLGLNPGDDEEGAEWGRKQGASGLGKGITSSSRLHQRWSCCLYSFW